MCIRLVRDGGRNSSPRTAQRKPTKMGSTPGAQVGTMRMPDRLGDTACTPMLVLYVAAAGRLVPFRWRTLSQPICHAWGVLRQRFSQHVPIWQVPSPYLQQRRRHYSQHEGREWCGSHQGAAPPACSPAPRMCMETEGTGAGRKQVGPGIRSRRAHSLIKGPVAAEETSVLHEQVVAQLVRNGLQERRG